jgi:hypothetical protein
MWICCQLVNFHKFFSPLLAAYFFPPVLCMQKKFINLSTKGVHFQWF